MTRAVGAGFYLGLAALVIVGAVGFLMVFGPGGLYGAPEPLDCSDRRFNSLARRNPGLLLEEFRKCVDTLPRPTPEVSDGRR